MLDRFVSPLRDPRWLTPARTSAYLRILAGMSLALALGWAALSTGGLDRLGNPLGTDFLSFYAASALALSGRVADVYVPALHHAAETAVFGQDTGYAAFFYPPPFLLVCLGLATLPYLVALAAWVGATGFAYVGIVRSFLRASGAGMLPILAFPAVLCNAGHGQNGFLTAALFGGGVLLLARRPVLAGLLFGGLVIKPHLALVLPFAFAAVGAWRTGAATAAAGLGLCALATIVLGPAAWEGFRSVSPLARATLEDGWVDPAKMQSTFAALRLLGAGVPVAYAGQAVATALALLVLVWLGRRRPDLEAFGVATASAALLATPFLLDYDLTLLAVPLAWLFREGRRDGFRPWEQGAMMAAYLLPLVSRPLAITTGLPIAPLVLAAMFGLVARRVAETATDRAASRSRRSRPPDGHAARPSGNHADPGERLIRLSPAL